MENNTIINGNCWVACVDVLGFKAKVWDFERGCDGVHLDIFVKNFYGELIKALNDKQEFWPDRVFITWFSDTFVFFSRDDSKESFTWMSAIAKDFCECAISKSWPLRGAIGFGQLYADKTKNIFLGSGLIDAYEYAEKQNWIGLVVTPKTNEKLCELDVDLKSRRAAFKEWDVPMKRKKSEYGTYDFEEETERVFAARIQQLPSVQRGVQAAQTTSMSSNRQGYEERYRAIYENTLKFFKESK